MSKEEREEKYNAIRKDYMKVVEDSQEKIQIAEESYALVDRYLRKLEQELHKFQLELEADHRGITEVLEKRSPSSRSIAIAVTFSLKSGSESAKNPFTK